MSGAIALARSPLASRLGCLNLRGNPVGWPGLAEMQAAGPECLRLPGDPPAARPAARDYRTLLRELDLVLTVTRAASSVALARSVAVRCPGEVSPLCKLGVGRPRRRLAAVVGRTRIGGGLMKIWVGYASSHSTYCSIIGAFTSADLAVETYHVLRIIHEAAAAGLSPAEVAEPFTSMNLADPVATWSRVSRSSTPLPTGTGRGSTCTSVPWTGWGSHARRSESSSFLSSAISLPGVRCSTRLWSRWNPCCGGWGRCESPIALEETIIGPYSTPLRREGWTRESTGSDLNC